MAQTNSQIARNKVAILSRHHPDSEELEEARRDLNAAKLEAYVKQILKSAPPLTDTQRTRISRILLMEK